MPAGAPARREFRPLGSDNVPHSRRFSFVSMPHVFTSRGSRAPFSPVQTSVRPPKPGLGKIKRLSPHLALLVTETLMRPGHQETDLLFIGALMADGVESKFSRFFFKD